MTLQLHSCQHAKPQQRRIIFRKINWTIVAVIPIFIFIQTKTIVNLMRNDDNTRTDISLPSETLQTERINRIPTLWEDSRRNDTVKSHASLVVATTKDPLQQSSHATVPGDGPTRKWAYVFLLGGCNPDEPEYRGFLVNVMMVSWRLRNMGSRADMVLLLQMSTKSPHRKLPASEEQLLTDLNIKFRYIPTFASKVHEVFYALMMEKFRIFEYAGVYSRVIYLDADQWPLCSLDYVFELSEPPVGQTPRIKENMLVAWKTEPCNGGFFMFTPQVGDYELILSIIRRREEEALQMPFPYWDQTLGWGHVFSQSDKWTPSQSRPNLNRTKWGWHGAFTDQGLIYYWAKYVKQSVSLVINKKIENWGSCDGTACLQNVLLSEFDKYTCSDGYQQPGTPMYPPYSSIFHMTGRLKPWVASRKNNKKMTRVWFEELARMEREVLQNRTILSDEMHLLKERKKKPSVGSFPVYNQMYNHIKDKVERNWNPYETLDVETKL